MVINFLTRSEKIQELIKLITGDKEVKDIVTAIFLQDSSLFIYNVLNSAKVEDDFPDPEYNVDDVKVRATAAVEFQLVLRNFKTSKKINIMKAYLFRSLGVYLIDDLALSSMSMPK